LEPISIEIRNLTKCYRKKLAIDSVNLRLESGKLHVFVGKNGSGKSTLMKCVMKHVHYKGEIIKKRYRIGYAPEKYIMPEYMTVYEFLRSIGRIKDLYEPYLHLELMEYLKILHIEDRLHHRLKQLSNGMKQKVNLIQALLNNPKIILLDEPLVGLDEESQKKFVQHVISLSKQRLVIVSTHHPHKFNTKNKVIHFFQNGCVQS